MTGQRALFSGRHELSGDQDWLSLYYDVSEDFSSSLFPSGRRPAVRQDEFNSVARASLRGTFWMAQRSRGFARWKWQPDSLPSAESRCEVPRLTWQTDQLVHVLEDTYR